MQLANFLSTWLRETERERERERDRETEREREREREFYTACMRTANVVECTVLCLRLSSSNVLKVSISHVQAQLMTNVIGQNNIK